MDKKAVASSLAPSAIGPYSPGVVADGMIFLSGQIGLDPRSGSLAVGVVAQAEQVLSNIGALLAEAGAGFEDVVKCTVFLADIADFSAVNDVYASRFPKSYPARSAVQVAALPAGALVEIEVIARVPSAG
ncbi:MAG: Rid family detoxifying hydrolase [Collinsella sp.]|nr:Rid family detoxifying hydrolase [Collinsella sp.]